MGARSKRGGAPPVDGPPAAAPAAPAAPEPAPAPPEASPADTSGGASWGAADAANDGAGWVLGVLLWAWVVLPFIRGGPTEVKRTLRAKFLNEAPDGSELP